MFQLTNLNNLEIVLITFLNECGVDVESDVIIAELKKHPDYPSILSISDVVSNFGIANSAFEITAEQLVEMPCPFIAHTNLNNENLVLVHDISGQTCIISDGINRRHSIPFEFFAKNFNKIILLPEEISEPGLKIFLNKISRLMLPFAYFVVSLLIVVFHTSLLINFSVVTLSIEFIKIVGLLTSVLLLVQSIDQNNPLVKKICSGNNKIDCNAILSSKAAVVFRGLSWSEMGFFYFSATLILLTFYSDNGLVIQFLRVVNILGLPFTFYSIYFQAYVARQWCILCCVVQALLWVEFALFSGFSQTVTTLSAVNLSLIVIVSIIPVIVWKTIKPLLIKAHRLRSVNKQLYDIKYNDETFLNLLKKQKRYSIPDSDNCIVMGNPFASTIVVVVSNPYCGPCMSVHKDLDKWLDIRDDIQIRLLFNSNQNNLPSKIVEHLMILDEPSDKKVVRKALHNWYAMNRKDYDQWSALFPIDSSTDCQVVKGKLDAQRLWLEHNTIDYTPAVLVNGYVLPEMYSLSDLKYLLQNNSD